MSEFLRRLDAAFSAAGAGMAKHLRSGDAIEPADFTRRLAEAVNYSLRARGLRMRAVECEHGEHGVDNIRIIVIEAIT